jgi:hypothetical protein
LESTPVTETPKGAKPAAADATGEGARKSRRFSVFWRARVQAPNGALLDARVIDVSLEGLAFSCEHPFGNGAKVSLSAAIPHPKDIRQTVTVNLPCRVVYQTMAGGDFRMGAVMERLSDSTQKLLQLLIQERAMRT